MLKALARSQEPELLPHTPKPQPLSILPDAAALPGLRPRARVMLLEHGAAPQGRMLQATTSKRCWSPLENHLPCPASPLQETPAFYFTPNTSLPCTAASPASRSISSCRKSTPSHRPAQPPFSAGFPGANPHVPRSKTRRRDSGQSSAPAAPRRLPGQPAVG